MTKVLVVDDDVNLRQVIAMFLQLGGYETIEGRNGKEAVDYSLKYLPDAIVLDVMTPILDGFTACTMIKARPETKNIPVILCTAKNMKEDFLQALKVGADDYLVKPFRKDVLLEKVVKVLKSKKERIVGEKRGARRKKVDWLMTWGVIRNSSIVPPYKNKVLNVSLKGVAFEFHRCDICTGYTRGSVHSGCLLSPFGVKFEYSQEIDLMLSTDKGNVLTAKGKIANFFQYDDDPINEVVGVAFTKLPDETRQAISKYIEGQKDWEKKIDISAQS